MPPVLVSFGKKRKLLIFWFNIEEVLENKGDEYVGIGGSVLCELYRCAIEGQSGYYRITTDRQIDFLFKIDMYNYTSLWYKTTHQMAYEKFRKK